MTSRREDAKIYIRRNGAFGSSCDGCQDTGHVITENSGMFTVYPVTGDDTPIIRDASRKAAEDAISEDWRAPF